MSVVLLFGFMTGLVSRGNLLVSETYCFSDRVRPVA